MLKRKRWAIAVWALVLAGVIGLGMHHRSAGAGNSLTGSEANHGGKTAPDFTLLDVRTGKAVRLSDFKGKAVVLNFWATWCPPCAAEIPWFIDLQKQYASQGLQVIGVAMDDSGADGIATFAKEANMNYPVMQGTNQVGSAYGGVESLPTTFYIDREGKISKRAFGISSRRETEENVKAILNLETPKNGTSSTGGF